MVRDGSVGAGRGVYTVSPTVWGSALLLCHKHLLGVGVPGRAGGPSAHGIRSGSAGGEDGPWERPRELWMKSGKREIFCIAVTGGQRAALHTVQATSRNTAGKDGTESDTQFSSEW